MLRIYKIVASIILFLTASVFSLEVTESEQYLKDLLINRYNLDTKTHTVDVLTNPFKKLKKIPVQLRFIPISQKEPLGLFSARLEINEEGKPTRQVQVKYQINRFQDVLIVNDRISRYKVIEQDNVLIERKNITQLRERPVISFND